MCVPSSHPFQPGRDCQAVGRSRLDWGRRGGVPGDDDDGDDDDDYDADDNDDDDDDDVYQAAYHVIWSFLVEDSNMFLKYFMEKLTRENQEEMFQIIRNLIRKG